MILFSELSFRFKSNSDLKASVPAIFRQCWIDYEPEKMLATAAMMKLKTTPGPAMFLATMPATRYIPVPQHDPTPNEVKSNVVKHF